MSVLALVVLGVAAPQLASAQAAGSVPPGLVSAGTPPGQQQTNADALLLAFYPPGVVTTFPAGTTQANPPEYAGLQADVAYTAGMQPGAYPELFPVLPVKAWGPSVAAWFGGGSISAAQSAANSLSWASAAPMMVPTLSPGKDPGFAAGGKLPPGLTIANSGASSTLSSIGGAEQQQGIAVHSLPPLPPRPSSFAGAAQQQTPQVNATAQQQFPQVNATAQQQFPQVNTTAQQQIPEISVAAQQQASDVIAAAAAQQIAEANAAAQQQIPQVQATRRQYISQVPRFRSARQAPAPQYPVTLGMPATKLWDGAGLRAIKVSIAYKNATAQLLSAANSLIIRAKLEASKSNFYSVTLQTLFIPPSKSKNDYISIGPYMWGCKNGTYPPTCTPRTATGKLFTPSLCNQATQLPWISCDVTGEKNPSVPTALLGDTQVTSYWTAMTDLTMAYYYTENTTYATRAAYLTRQFFVNTTTKMNPNMNFGQMWPGARDGSPSGVVEINKFVEILDCVAILRLNSAVWTPADDTNVMNWFRLFYAWYNTNTLGIQARDSTNNIAWWWVHTMLAINLHVANPTAANSIAARILSTTSGQIFTNGNLTQEVARANSKQYTAYALTAIARCAQMARFTPTNLFASPKFIATFTMFSQYANSAKPWPYADKDPSSTYSWKFWAEWLHLAAIGRKNAALEAMYNATSGAFEKAYGVQPGLVHKSL